ncbi:Mucin-associated surface protein (MASP) [Trypanosoma cruzi]|uniref:Mucin-associated surface protein (MASP), putative n=2 Tax=Trypanosoma cruzi TaxID=5693 RepID=Q4D2X7_TRYCC|nr:mucin-associated surface protein (MASP), putative [Trypanosoma cruzi]EAN86875.1 mucin-associated surface protein (MASP), putative [Trypanosoma cruzi]PWV14217.1 Mucin-associated surface protein (MASP) [Trypanosoma cruzi]|eukprot:XP_808726.1 mucin-associated surface protein (MASP) [Trypanosoma cruzi strain CL Brener]
MAMMMTGRVLLVCALCVLWCGLVSADAGGDDFSGGHGTLGGSGVGADGRPSVPVGGEVSTGGTKDECSLGSGGGSPVSASPACKSLLSDAENPGGEAFNDTKKGLSRVEEDPDAEQDPPQPGSHVVSTAEVPAPGQPNSEAQEQSSGTLRTEEGRNNGDGGTTAKEEVTGVESRGTADLYPNDSRPSKAARPVTGEEKGTEKQAASKASLTPAEGRGTSAATDQKVELPKEKAASSAGATKNRPPVGQQQTEPSSPFTSGSTSTLTPEKEPAEEVHSNNNQPPGDAVPTEGTQHETLPGDKTQTEPATTNNKLIDAAPTGDSESSPTAPPAGESDAATTTTPNNHDARSLNNNGNNAFTEEVDQKEAARKPKSAPHSIDTAAANSEASTAAVNISTNTKNKTTTGDSDSSTAVSHTISPLLLLLVVACADAVVAA